MTVWQAMKEGWIIKKYEIKDLGINPNKEWGEITLNELGVLADHLDVTIGDIVD